MAASSSSCLCIDGTGTINDFNLETLRVCNPLLELEITVSTARF